jgi:CDP-diacylglycerol--serine O-phosphatidyltransferase
MNSFFDEKSAQEGESTDDRREPSKMASLGRKTVYLLPNSFTTASLFFGIYAIVQAANNAFEVAAIAIFCSMVLDGMDGRIARYTNTQSEFGVQYDSLADMVAFGVAPALILYDWQLKGLGKFGWVATFVYVTGAALRLARFNVKTGSVDKRWFQGLPSPAAAALTAGLVWLVVDGRLSLDPVVLPWLVWGVAVFAGISMVSSLPFYSFKVLDLGAKISFPAFLVVILAFCLIFLGPSVALCGFFLFYGLSGYVIGAMRLFRRRKQKKLK